MERTMSVEEKIKRAEEIYERRKGLDKQITTVNIENSEKKDIKLLKKIIIQITACVAIYLTIYAIQNNNYIFSKDIINTINEMISYDYDYINIYKYIKEKIVKLKNSEENVASMDENIGGIGENNEKNTEEKSEENILEGLDEKVLSQEEQDILKINEMVSFIKPIDGIISSKYGWRDSVIERIPKNHTGTDIAANIGTKIKSATDGEVVLASSEGDYRETFKNSNWGSKCNICTL